MTTTDTTTLAERYEAALLAGDVDQIEEIEADFAANEVANRRAAALRNAEAKQAAAEAAQVEQERVEAAQAARAEAQDALDAAEKELRAAAAAFASSADQVMRLGVTASNASLHLACAQTLRSAIAGHCTEPWRRRLLSEVGRPNHFGGGSIGVGGEQ